MHSSWTVGLNDADQASSHKGCQPHCDPVPNADISTIVSRCWMQTDKLVSVKVELVVRRVPEQGAGSATVGRQMCSSSRFRVGSALPGQ